METLKCTKCNEDAYTNDEFVSGECRICGGELEDENVEDDTERDMGYYFNDF